MREERRVHLLEVAEDDGGEGPGVEVLRGRMEGRQGLRREPRLPLQGGHRLLSLRMQGGGRQGGEVLAGREADRDVQPVPAEEAVHRDRAPVREGVGEDGEGADQGGNRRAEREEGPGRRGRRLDGRGAGRGGGPRLRRQGTAGQGQEAGGLQPPGHLRDGDGQPGSLPCLPSAVEHRADVP